MDQEVSDVLTKIWMLEGVRDSDASNLNDPDICLMEEIQGLGPEFHVFDMIDDNSGQLVVSSLENWTKLENITFRGAELESKTKV